MKIRPILRASLIVMTGILILAACEDRPALSDGRYLAISDIDRGDGWVAWLYAEVSAGQVIASSFDYVHRERGVLMSHDDEAIAEMENSHGIAPHELFSRYAALFAADPGPRLSVEEGPASVARHISALAIGIVEASSAGLNEPVLVSAPGDGTAIDGRQLAGQIPVDVPGR